MNEIAVAFDAACQGRVEQPQLLFEALHVK